MEKKANQIVYWIMPIYFTIAFVEFYTGIFRLSMITKIFAILASVIITMKHPKNGMSDLMWVLIFTNILSFPLTILSGRPISCYTNEIFNYVPAMLFYFVGASSNVNTEKFYKYLLISATISFTIGLFLYFTAPDWYVLKLAEWANRSKIAIVEVSEMSVLEHTRFQSYLMSEYAISHFTMFGLAVACFAAFREDKCKIPSKWVYLSILILLVSAIISQMRVAMFCSVACFLAFVIYDIFISRKGKSLRIILVIILILVTVGTYFVYSNGEQFELVSSLMSNRIEEMSISKALKGRENQVENLMSTWNWIIIGHGLGSGGAISLLGGYSGVTDQNYIKILYENGLLGMLLFMIIIIKTLIKAIKKYRYYTIELVIIAFVMVAMLGSNTLCFSYLYILPFWFAIGRVWNKKYIQYAFGNKIHI